MLPTHLRAHTVLIGHGRVGGRVAAALAARKLPYVVVEADLDSAAGLLKQGIPVVYGDAARPGVLEHAGVKDARLLVVTAPDAFQARAAIELARRVQPEIDIVVRTHSDSERTYLEGKNVGKAVMGEHELAEAMARYALEKTRDGIDSTRTRNREDDMAALRTSRRIRLAVVLVSPFLTASAVPGQNYGLEEQVLNRASVPRRFSHSTATTRSAEARTVTLGDPVPSPPLSPSRTEPRFSSCASTETSRSSRSWRPGSGRHPGWFPADKCRRSLGHLGVRRRNPRQRPLHRLCKGVYEPVFVRAFRLDRKR